MLTFLKIKNVALIDELAIEFAGGLNLLTGETGSGKSIIVDSLAALTGDRVSNDIIKQGEDAALIEAMFKIDAASGTAAILNETGVELDSDEVIIRREISQTGRNRVFVNDQLATLAFLKRLGPRLADIHGQGEQSMLFDAGEHLAMLDSYAGLDKQKASVAAAYRDLSEVRSQLAELERDESEKLQLVDILKFQVDEIASADLKTGEDAELEDEKRRLNNVEKLSALSDEAHLLLYDDEQSALSTLDRAAKVIAELARYDSRFRGFDESLDSARAVVADLGLAARDLGASLEFSPDRINEIENRLAEISRLKRKYGGTIEAALEHLRLSSARLGDIETSEFREEELKKQLDAALNAYRVAAAVVHDKRVAAAARFSKQIEHDLRAVALEKARFEVRVDDADVPSSVGSDRVDFLFSANPGEEPRPLAKVASGGEASRLMLVIKTVSRTIESGKTAVFDEIDIGIGGRVAEAVGRKLKALAATQQVFCVTHQPQIASLADHHFVVEKEMSRGKTRVAARELNQTERVEELARMLAGQQITEQARENARAMLAAAG